MLRLHEVDTEPDLPEEGTNLASWYTPGLSDGVGDRLLMFDNSTSAPLEMLRFRRELSEAPGFEAALRARVEELADFDHPAFGRVRTVARLGDEQDLALVSNQTIGQRLSEVLDLARGPRLAEQLIRRLTPALAALHEQGPGIAHGLLTAERVIVTPGGGLVVVEHVLGSAIQSLGLDPSELQATFGLGFPPDTTVASLDARRDVMEVGHLALSLIVGRRITGADGSDRVADLLDEIGRTQRSPRQLQIWLERALQLDGATFRSARDAADALADWTTGPELDAPPPPPKATVLKPTFAKPRQPEPTLTVAALPPRPVSPPKPPEPELVESDEFPEEPSEVPEPPAFAHEPGIMPVERSALLDGSPAIRQDSPAGRLEPAVLRPEPPAIQPQLPVLYSEPRAADSEYVDAPLKLSDLPEAPPSRRPGPPQWLVASRVELADRLARARTQEASKSAIASLLHRPPAEPGPVSERRRWIMRGLVGVAALEAAAIIVLAIGNWTSSAPDAVVPARRTPSATSAGTTTVASAPQPGPESVLSSARGGAPKVAAPATVRRPASSPRVPTNVGTGARAAVSMPSSAPATASAATSVPPAPAPPPPPPGRGEMTVTSEPAGAMVSVDGTRLGATPLTIQLSAGDHALVVTTGAYVTKQLVRIEAGRTSATKIAVPSTVLSVAAMPWANVWLDGQSLGRTPVADVAILAGPHELVFRNPDLGERRQQIEAAPFSPVRLSVNFREP